MHILYIHQYFKIPQEPGGTRSYWIARKLIEHGYKVTMLTSSSSIEKNVEKKDIDGISVIYLRVPYDQKMGVFKRLISFVRFIQISHFGKSFTKEPLYLSTQRIQKRLLRQLRPC